MLKNQLIKAVAKDTGIGADQVRRVIESIFDQATAAIKRGEEVFLLGLGKISISRRGPKTARHMVTGEKVVVPSRSVPVFRPSVALTEAAQKIQAE